ncbi:GAF domain-containing sensor histidine kinase [Natribaculum luteum]|uniref:histidine kinase n=1 Tax=Natribaculum luteum TaxID=1586232 RepID=A0ABD5P5R6_9EURY|nr:ATP-binding protein [Natribaculum luteum]
MTETVLYVAASHEDAHEGATALERAGSTLTVEPAVSLAKVHECVPAVDCVVFAETPTTADGAHLLEVVDACGSKPLVLFTDAAYSPKAARATDGIDGYVRREGEAAVAHLADEIAWMCNATGDDGGLTAGPGMTDAEAVTDDSAEVAATLENHERRSKQRRRDRRECVLDFHEATVQIVAAADEAELYDRAVATAENCLAFDCCRVLTDDDGEFVTRASAVGDCDRSWPLEDDHDLAAETLETGESVLVDDVRESALVETDGGPWSIVSVPIGEVGVFQAVTAGPDAFDDAALELVESLVAHVTETVARLRTEAALVSERDRLSALFDNVPDPTVRYEFVDGDAVVRDVNDAFEEAFGYDREAVLDENVDEYVVPPNLDDEARQLNETLLAGECLQVVSRRQTADGIRDFLINVVPLALGKRGVEGFSIYTDITEQKRRERELAAQNERLDEFASIVSHDLRSPLNVARGYLELAKETGDDEHVAEVEAAHERMRSLIDELLALSRRGSVIGETEPVAVHDVARRAWATVDTGDAELVLENDAIVEADKARLIEILENLIRNATDHGDDAVTVRLGATEGGFFVADDGPGIPAAERDAVFDSGYTTADDGTGLGLSIVEEIVDAHGWTVEVTDGDDGGARFEIRGVETDAVDSADLEDDQRRSRDH